MAFEYTPPKYAQVNASLSAVGYMSAFDVLRTYIGRRKDLEPWLHGVEINHAAAA